MIKQSVYYLYLKDFPKVLVAVIDDELFVSLNDALKRFKLKRDDPKVKDLVITERITANVDGQNKRIEVIDIAIFKQLSEMDHSGDGLKFYTQVMKHKFDREHNEGNLTPNDLESIEDRERFIEERNILLSRVEVLEAKERTYAPYVKTIKTIFGARISPVNFVNIATKLKYVKPPSASAISEILRLAGVFDDNDQPKPHFVKENYFRIIVTSEARLTKTQVVSNVLVLQKGIQLIESLIDKKYGGGIK
ncbi:MAG TPA: hypothetical protein PLH44_04720 [Bacilli bacterium]|nr:hypothetical protein [Bacilli bacterium]